MINRIFKSAASVVGVWLMRNYEKASIELVKIRAVSAYVKMVAGIRMALMGVFAILMLTALLVSSFLIANVAIIFLLANTEHARVIAILVVSLIYFFICLAAVIMACSERLWMRVSKANKLVAQYSNQHPPHHLRK